MAEDATGKVIYLMVRADKVPKEKITRLLDLGYLSFHLLTQPVPKLEFELIPGRGGEWVVFRAKTPLPEDYREITPLDLPYQTLESQLNRKGSHEETEGEEGQRKRIRAADFYERVSLIARISQAWYFTNLINPDQTFEYLLALTSCYGNLFRQIEKNLITPKADIGLLYTPTGTWCVVINEKSLAQKLLENKDLADLRNALLVEGKPAKAYVAYCKNQTHALKSKVAVFLLIALEDPLEVLKETGCPHKCPDPIFGILEEITNEFDLMAWFGDEEIDVFKFEGGKLQKLSKKKRGIKPPPSQGPKRLPVRLEPQPKEPEEGKPPKKKDPLLDFAEESREKPDGPPPTDPKDPLRKIKD